MFRPFVRLSLTCAAWGLACGGAPVDSPRSAVSVASTDAPSLQAPRGKCAATPSGGPAKEAQALGRVRKLLGDQGALVLSQVTRAEAFRMRLDPANEHSPPNAPRVAGFLMASPPRPISPELMTKLVTLLADDTTYDFASDRSCEIGPLFGFRLWKEALSVDVALEFNGEKIFVTTADEPRRGRGFSSHFGHVRAILLAMIRDVFPQDPDLPRE